MEFGTFAHLEARVSSVKLPQNIARGRDVEYGAKVSRRYQVVARRVLVHRVQMLFISIWCLTAFSLSGSYEEIPSCLSADTSISGVGVSLRRIEVVECAPGKKGLACHIRGMFLKRKALRGTHQSRCRSPGHSCQKSIRLSRPPFVHCTETGRAPWRHRP
jgi:hypothetical protein